MTGEIQALRLARNLVENGAARGVREAAGLSRSEMARGAGVSVAAIRAWEGRRRRPHGHQGEAYGKALSSLMTGAPS